MLTTDGRFTTHFGRRTIWIADVRDRVDLTLLGRRRRFLPRAEIHLEVEICQAQWSYIG